MRAADRQLSSRPSIIESSIPFAIKYAWGWTADCAGMCFPRKDVNLSFTLTRVAAHSRPVENRSPVFALKQRNTFAQKNLEHNLEFPFSHLGGVHCNIFASDEKWAQELSFPIEMMFWAAPQKNNPKCVLVFCAKKKKKKKTATAPHHTGRRS